MKMNHLLEQMLANSVYVAIKAEPRALCDGCLSDDRTLAPLGKLRDLFYRILNHDEKDKLLGLSFLWQTEPRLCWECRKLLRNTYTFQQRVFEAQKSLHLAEPIGAEQSTDFTPSTLSNLSQSFKDTYDYHYICDAPLHVTVTKSEPPEYDSLQLDEFEFKASEFDEFEYKASEFPDCNVEISEFDGYNGQRPDFKKESDVKEYKLAPRGKRRKRCLKPKLEDSGDADETFTFLYASKSDWEEERRRKAVGVTYNSAEYKCDQCIIVFRSQGMLKKHYESLHNPNNTFKCEICPAQLKTEAKLRLHQHLHVYYKCNKCQYKVTRSDYFYNHYENNHTYTIQCTDCEEVFPSRRAMDGHIRERHSAFVCDHCGKMSRSKNAIATHIHGLHMPAACAPCAQTFKNQRMLHSHNKLKHTKKKSEARYCVECDITYDTGALYAQHVKIHHGKRYPCSKCKKSYKTRWHLEAHYDYFHERRTKHYCAQCDKYFIRKYALQRHERRMHQHLKVSYPKKHICEHCSRGFAWIRDLVQHVRTHTGERPHACALCPARFAQESPLVTHMRRVHGAQGGFRELLELNELRCNGEGEGEGEGGGGGTLPGSERAQAYSEAGEGSCVNLSLIH